jgi:tRNA dimethylallyltransferase
MIDIVDPDEDFDAAAYATMATDSHPRDHRPGRLPLVVGGTGFYIKALVSRPIRRRTVGSGGSPAPESSVLNRRKAGVLHRRLAAVDRAAAARIHPNDTYRIMRALEVFAVTGEPLSVFQQRHGFQEQRFDTLEIGLTWPRPILYDRINRRVEAMMDQGLEEEVSGSCWPGATQ